jgi:hypothetical protein
MTLQQARARAMRALHAVPTVSASYVPDALLIAGACLVAYGAWRVYAPAGFIVAGLFCLAAGFLGARKDAA